jgi:hypothetical protein
LLSFIPFPGLCNLIGFKLLAIGYIKPAKNLHLSLQMPVFLKFYKKASRILLKKFKKLDYYLKKDFKNPKNRICFENYLKV